MATNKGNKQPDNILEVDYSNLSIKTAREAQLSQSAAVYLMRLRTACVCFLMCFSLTYLSDVMAELTVRVDWPIARGSRSDRD